MNKFWSNLAEKWPKYLIAFIAAVFCWTIVIDIVVSPRRSERIEIFVGSYGLSDEINDVVNKPSYIEELIFTNVRIDESYYFVLFASYASSKDVDAFIVKESQFRESDIQYFQKLSDDKVNEYFGVSEYFTVNGDIYGIKIYDCETKTGFLTEYIDYSKEGKDDEDYYIFFSKYSAHIGKLNDSSYDGVVQILNYLKKEGRGKVGD